MLIELVDGFFLNPELVAVVKKTDVDQCAVFTAGQSAIDGGFAIDGDALKVAQVINDAITAMYENEEDEERSVKVDLPEEE